MTNCNMSTIACERRSGRAPISLDALSEFVFPSFDRLRMRGSQVSSPPRPVAGLAIVKEHSLDGEKGSGSGARGRAFRLISMWRELAPRSVSVPRLAGHSAAPCTFHGQSPRLLRISLPRRIPFAEPGTGKRRPVVGPSEPRLPTPWREVTAALPDTRCAPDPVRAMGELYGRFGGRGEMGAAIHGGW